MKSVSQESPDHQVVSDVAWKVVGAKRIAMITGAGISCNAGIPDFRSSHGLYEEARAEGALHGARAIRAKGKNLFDVGVLAEEDSAQLFFKFIQRLKGQIARAEPTPTHGFIELLAARGKLLRCYTQNIDGIERQLALNVGIRADAQVIPLHGEMQKVRCVVCNKSDKWTSMHSDAFNQGTGFECPHCLQAQNERVARGKRRTGRLGIMRPDIVLYGEEHSRGDEIARIMSKDVRANPDMLFIIGTTLQIPGVKKLVKSMATKVHQKGGLVVLINATKLPKIWDNIIDVHLEGDCDFWVSHIKQSARDWFSTQSLVTEAFTETQARVPESSPGKKRKREPLAEINPKLTYKVPRVESKSQRVAEILSMYAR